MISVALFGVLSLGMSQVFLGFVKQNSDLEKEIELNEQMSEFHERLDLELGNATQIIGCGCGSTWCFYAETSPDSTSGSNCAINSKCDSILLSWETEASQTPGQLAENGGSTCLNGGTGRSDLRGCKQIRILRMTPPTDTTPGALSIENESGQVLSTLNGVAYVFCGRPANNFARQTMNSFKFRIRAKARHSMIGDSSHADFESWMPGGQNFTRGVHREFNSEVSLRNFVQNGTHFGKTSTNPACISDGKASSVGLTCCSGFSDGNICVSEEACKVKGEKTPVADHCCSHQRLVSTGICL
jgi:hypothetical protein